MAARTIEQFVERASRLYEQERGRPDGPSRLGAYVRRWGRWAVAGLREELAVPTVTWDAPERMMAPRNKLTYALPRKALRNRHPTGHK